ncbi:MAG: carbohydrate-binding family 9-like protein [Saprospiraceae bacterium]
MQSHSHTIPALNNRLVLFFGLFAFGWSLSVQAQNDSAKEQMTYQHAIPFVPEQYLCYRTATPIQIDGKLTDAAWSLAPWTNDFVDIEGDLKPKPEHRTRVKMLWDDEYFYFAAMLEEPHLWATLHQRDTIIFYDDDFEIFIDPDGDGHTYAEFEMNANNTVWDMLMLRPYHIGRSPNTIFNWNNLDLHTAVHLEGTLNKSTDTDQYWTVEIAFPWSALKELVPKKALPASGDQWRVNFSRVDWHVDILNGRYVKKKAPGTDRNLPPENWVWSPTGRVDMHRPETWGFVQFSENTVDHQADQFIPNSEEDIKWALWQLFYQQQAFYKKYGSYTADISHFTLPPLADQPFTPQFYASPNTFEILTASSNGGTWHIDHTGRIWKKS